MKTLPKFLYKYQFLSKDDDNHALENLRNRQIYFQHPREFDDPYDCAIQIIKEFSNTEIDRLWESRKRGELNINLSYASHSSQYQTNGKPNDRFKEAIVNPVKNGYELERKKILDQWGISCFSARNDILLMWSHYGSGHKGFCLEFDTTCDLFTKAREVSYPDTEEIPSFSTVDILNKQVPALMPMILTKAKCWEHQEEWRIFVGEGDKSKVYDKGCLSRIFFGAKSSREDQLKIIETLGDSPTQLYIMEPDSRSFHLQPIEYVKWLGKQSDVHL